jgi:RNA polymerase sigma-70 factor (ECF subfamily)
MTATLARSSGGYLLTRHACGSTSARVAQAIGAAQRGDRDALGFLYTRYADEVFVYVRRIVRDEHEAEDITQQVFAKLVRSIERYEPRQVPFVAWVMRVARNLAIDHLRSQRMIPMEEVRGSDARSVDPARGRPMSELQDALSVLPVDQREVLVLRHFAGLSPSEIATRTGRSEGSIHGLHHRGRRALQAELTSRGVAPATASRSTLSR